jgi:hypothetical protein
MVGAGIIGGLWLILVEIPYLGKMSHCRDTVSLMVGAGIIGGLGLILVEILYLGKKSHCRQTVFLRWELELLADWG